MASQDPSQISSSSTSSSVSPSQRRQVVYGPGVTQSQQQRRQSQSSQSQNKKKSNATTAPWKKKPVGKKINFPDMPEIDVSSIYCVVPSPGYGNPLNLSSIPENTGKIIH